MANVANVGLEAGAAPGDWERRGKARGRNTRRELRQGAECSGLGVRRPFGRWILKVGACLPCYLLLPAHFPRRPWHQSTHTRISAGAGAGAWAWAPLTVGPWGRPSVQFTNTEGERPGQEMPVAPAGQLRDFSRCVGPGITPGGAGPGEGQRPVQV